MQQSRRYKGISNDVLSRPTGDHTIDARSPSITHCGPTIRADDEAAKLRQIAGCVVRDVPSLERWLTAAYGELAMRMVDGVPQEYEVLDQLIVEVLEQAEDKGRHDVFASRRVHIVAMRCLLEGIREVVKGDAWSGIVELRQVCSMGYCDDSLRWAAWHWIVKAAAAIGDEAQRSEATEALRQVARSLDERGRKNAAEDAETWVQRHRNFVVAARRRVDDAANTLAAEGSASTADRESRSQARVPAADGCDSDQAFDRGAFTGTLDLLPVPDLLEFMGVSKRSGTLVFESPFGRGHVRLCEGRIAGAASPGALRIGQLLVQGGALSEGALQVALGRRQRYRGRPLGEVLLATGMADASAVRAALEWQVRTIVAELLQWTDGCFVWQPEGATQAGCDTSSGSARVTVDLDARDVLLDLLRRVDEDSRPVRGRVAA